MHLGKCLKLIVKIDYARLSVVRGNNSNVDRGINGQWYWSRDQSAISVVRGNNRSVDRGINDQNVDREINSLWYWSND